MKQKTDYKKPEINKIGTIKSITKHKIDGGGETYGAPNQQSH